MGTPVHFLLENLSNLLVYQVDLISNGKSELELLHRDLRTLTAIMETASVKYKKDAVFEEWERQIVETVYDIEDAIDVFVTESATRKARSSFRFQKLFGSSDNLKQVRSLREYKLKVLFEDFNLKIVPNLTPSDRTDRTNAHTWEILEKKSKHVVGFEEETNLFVDLLTRDSNKLEITSIIGMGGLGKTTLAWKIFEHDTISYEFNIRLWVNVSDALDMRKVLLDIMSKLTTSKPDASVPNEELIVQVQSHLAGKKFLIVMDDVWTINAWMELKALLPPDNGEWGRVLITTRNMHVGRNFSMQPLLAHDLRFLTSNESWELLQFKVFGKLGDVPEELQQLGKHIAVDCNGLPLSIVVIGGILNEKTSAVGDNIAEMETEWNEVSKRMKSYLAGDNVVTSVLSLSYNKLPYELRNSFLYLGVFPEDADIPAKKLIRLWIAEGFIQERPHMRLEEVAWDNLKSLISRNLVMVRAIKHDGEPKICHIHDIIREICKREGSKLNIFQEICEGKLHANFEKCRRLSIHSDVLHFFSDKPKIPKARSFLSSKESSALDGAGVASITNAFALLRVYDAIDMKFQRFPLKLFQQLVHLRYLTLAVASEMNILPEAVTNLWNLQTLIVDTPSRTLEVKGDMWKMRHLRHFVTQSSIILKKKAGKDEGGEKLQTITKLSPESTDEVCEKAKSLVTLGIQGDLRVLEDSKCLGGLDSLYKLKLVHQVSGRTADSQLQRLPDSRSFPRSLKILVLSGTLLDWSIMSTLSDIILLKVLKLKDNAFQGSNWEVSGQSFRHLELLQIDRSDLKHWEDRDDHFPKLRCLEIKNCDKLQEIPSSLGKKLEVLTMERVTRAAVECAEKIKAEQEKQGRAVKLNIAAADRK